MRHISATPFGRRPMTAAFLAGQKLAEAPTPRDSVDKWLVLRHLTEARGDFSVSDRDLAVLGALLSFHPGKELLDDAALIVFPSNASLSGRLHGMPESTLRRHIAALVAAGLILRHDSPNGKRYATRADSGQIDRAFGFDLRPLLVRSVEIASRAEDAIAQRAETRRVRQQIVLHLRDAGKLLLLAIDTGLPRPDEAMARLAEIQRLLRRKLSLAQLTDLALRSAAILSEIQSLLQSEPEEMSGYDNKNERHIQGSDKELKESESCEGKGEQALPHTELPLEIILKAAPEILDYSHGSIRSWHELVKTAAFVRPMLGIDERTWRRTRQSMGDQAAATTIACILQRAAHIRQPGAYLNSLSRKALDGEFQPGPMVMALLRAEAA